ncbi:hypothetical protein [Candidatus Sodalis endolongispinus]|uniref:hypothetical protein n=1 Tax=Candidatus Sodalis endolongispinus TaxID=2812662 RepID=UPI001FE58445|nr:hypothetical protein [Candidatus Sodalis endolongispinus]
MYDLQRDPWQLHNIAAVPAYKTKIALFRQKLEQWRNETNDTGVIQEQQLVKDLQDTHGQTRVTLPPVAGINPQTNKIFIANRTDGASIGYSLDGKRWELYTGALAVPDDVRQLYIKAVRYGWQESETRAIPLSR